MRALTLALAALRFGPLVCAQQLEWTRPLGSEIEIGGGFHGKPTATDASGVHALGRSDPETIPAKQHVRKFDFAGRVLWTRKFDDFPGIVLHAIAPMPAASMWWAIEPMGSPGCCSRN